MDERDYERTTRTSYDAIAAEYAEHIGGYLATRPWDRAAVGVFAELVGGGRPVADVGCGTGEVTAHLHRLGVDVFGIDLSPAMLAEARRACPGVRFEQGSMLDLDVADGALGGVAACYSTIHVPEGDLPRVFAEFARVLAPGGHLLLAFQVGDEPRLLSEAFGHAVELAFHRRRPDRMAELLAGAGLVVRVRLLREAEQDERTGQAYLLARRPAGGRD